MDRSSKNLFKFLDFFLSLQIMHAACIMTSRTSPATPPKITRYFSCSSVSRDASFTSGLDWPSFSVCRA